MRCGQVKTRWGERREADGKQSSTIAQKFQFFVFTKFTYHFCSCCCCCFCGCCCCCRCCFSLVFAVKISFDLVFGFLCILCIKILNFKLSTHRKKWMKTRRRRSEREWKKQSRKKNNKSHNPHLNYKCAHNLARALRSHRFSSLHCSRGLGFYRHFLSSTNWLYLFFSLLTLWAANQMRSQWELNAMAWHA